MRQVKLVIVLASMAANYELELIQAGHPPFIKRRLLRGDQ